MAPRLLMPSANGKGKKGIQLQSYSCDSAWLQREREVFGLLVLGLLNKQIAGQLVTSERAIKFHRAHIMQRMRAGSLPDLVRMAQKLGLTGEP